VEEINSVLKGTPGQWREIFLKQPNHPPNICELMGWGTHLTVNGSHGVMMMIITMSTSNSEVNFPSKQPEKDVLI